MPDTETKLTYFVNGEVQETKKSELKVKEILEHAGFEPFGDYKLTRDEDHHAYDDYNHEVELREGERFTATFIGPTPTS